jgi:hypothetical protein
MEILVPRGGIMRKHFRYLMLLALLCIFSAPASAGYIFTFTAPDVSTTDGLYPGLTISVTLPSLYDGISTWNFTGAAFTALDPVLTGGAPGTTVDSLEIHRNYGDDEASFGVNLPSPFTNGVVYRFQNLSVEYTAPGFYPQNDSVLQGYPDPGVVFFAGATLDISPEPGTALLALAGIVAGSVMRRSRRA